MDAIPGILARWFWKAFDAVLYLNPFLGVAMVISGVLLVAFGIRFSDRAPNRTTRDTLTMILGMLLVAAGLLPILHRLARHLPPFARDIFD